MNRNTAQIIVFSLFVFGLPLATKACPPPHIDYQFNPADEEHDNGWYLKSEWTGGCKGKFIYTEIDFLDFLFSPAASELEPEYFFGEEKFQFCVFAYKRDADQKPDKENYKLSISNLTRDIPVLNSLPREKVNEIADRIEELEVCDVFIEVGSGGT